MRKRLTDESGSILLLMLITMPLVALLVATMFSLTVLEESTTLNGYRVLGAVKSSRLGVTYGGRQIAVLDASGSLPVGSGYTGTAPPSVLSAVTTWAATKTAGNEWSLTSVAVDRGSIVRTASGTMTRSGGAGSCPVGYDVCVPAPTTCWAPPGVTPVQVSVYVNGDICLTGSKTIQEPGVGSTLKVYAAGVITVTGATAFMGTNAKKLLRVTALGGITVGTAKVFALTKATAPSEPLSGGTWVIQP